MYGCIVHFKKLKYIHNFKSENQYIQKSTRFIEMSLPVEW